tara:strand:+ start:768 stop:3539 length:2772 start_codon:yes stop_codon:yes gene_type:complete
MATNTTATSQTHNGNGSTATFAITFSFLENSEVDVTVDGVLKTLGTHYNISSAAVTFTSGNIPPSGTNNIKFQRDTDISAKKVDFSDGSVLTETDLDNNSDQILFAQQEITNKLSGIEEGATGDQTAAEIRALVESATDSNVFTDADHTKLNGIETAATADQTASEIRTLVESASDSNVFTDADHSKLNGIEAGATGDQTNAEIRAAVEAASDSNVFTDADHSKLNAIEAGATADQTVSEIKSLIAGSPLDSSHLAANSVTTSEIADAELTTLAGMQSGTASKLADSTALTADIADLNQIDGLTKQTTISDTDASFPTSGAVVDYVAAQIAPIGGLEVIATDAAFPNTQPQAGVVVSIADAGGLVVNGSGTSTTARTVGGSTVTINNINSSFNNSTVTAGVGFLVSSTGSGQIYNFHKSVIRDQDILSISTDINDFANRYRVTDGEPTSNNDEGDLIYDRQADKMKVYDSSTSSFKEVTSVGDFKFLFLCPNGGTGSPTFNGSITTYDLRETSNTGSAASVTNAAQLLVSINGVVQKPNAGTSAPSEGFAMVDSNTIVFGDGLPTGAEVFVIQIGSAVSLQVPADNTVSSSKLQNGSVIEAKLGSLSVSEGKLAANAVTASKIAQNAVSLDKLPLGNNTVDGKFLRANNGAAPSYETVNTDLVADTSPQLGGNLDLNSNDINGTGNIGISGGISGNSLTLNNNNLIINGTQPNISFVDSDGNPDYLVKVNGGIFDIRDNTADASRLSVQSDGHVDVAGNLDVGAGIDCTGTCAATTFSGSGASLTNIPAANITGTLPAIDGSNLTGISAFVSGMIILWSGATNAIPSGWVICDGQNSTPDLRNRFIVGAGSTYNVGATGGATTDSITVSISGTTGSPSGLANEGLGLGTSMPTAAHTHSFSGSGSATVDTLPPYYALAYIMKT